MMIIDEFAKTIWISYLIRIRRRAYWKRVGFVNLLQTRDARIAIHIRGAESPIFMEVYSALPLT